MRRPAGRQPAPLDRPPTASTPSIPNGTARTIALHRRNRRRGNAAIVGYAVFRRFPPGVIAATIAFAAGAILAMIADTMMPEAYGEAHWLTGVLTVTGFLAPFLLTKIVGA
jgi:hypothetical protein